MSYSGAMEAAGAVVHDCTYFGSYQGDWWAKVTHNGETFFVSGSFGSCSWCDAFQAEFDYAEESCEEHRYSAAAPACAACSEAIKTYKEKLADFGRNYLDNNKFTYEEAMRSLTSKESEWVQEEYREQREWLQTQK